MEIIFKKGTDKDYITAIRADGSTVNTTFPKKGWYPHDAVHVIVETRLKLKRGFWGIVADGMIPEDVGALAKECGHASSKRAEIPGEEIRDLLIAERTVECFEAEMWSEPSDFATFRSVQKAACASSHVEMPPLSDEDISYIREKLQLSFEKWRSLQIGETMSMNWLEE